MVKKIYLCCYFVLLAFQLHAQTIASSNNMIKKRGYFGAHIDMGVLSIADSGYARFFKSQPILVRGFGVSIGRNVCLSLDYSSYTTYSLYLISYDTQGKPINDSSFVLTNSRLHVTLTKYVDFNEHLALRMRVGTYLNNGVLTLKHGRDDEVEHYEGQAFLIGAGVESPLFSTLCLYIDADYLYSADGSRYIGNTGGVQINAGLSVSFKQ